MRTVTQEDLNLLRQSGMQMHIKVDLCDQNYKTLDSIEGIVVGDNFSADNKSQQRRTYNCELVITNSSFTVGKDKKIWMDKRLRVYYGIYSYRKHEVLWYMIGTFLYIDLNVTISQTERKLSLSCADLMAQYDGTLNGQVGGYGSANSDSSHVVSGLKIPAGEDIRKSIIAVLKDARISSYVVEDIGKEIPFDLEFNTGTTYNDVWKKICELYDSWEYFFDVDGTFVWRQIPTCLEDPVVLNDEILQRIWIDENTTASFSGIYNVTEVWGKVLELDNDDRYSDTSTYADNTYSIDLTGYEKWEDVDHMTMIAFRVAANNQESPKFSLNGYTSIPIVDGNGIPLKAGALAADTVYVFRYRRETVDENKTIVAKLYLLGQFQCYGKYVENSDDCPFSVKNLGYEILKSVDYNTLSDDAACYNQAEYLTYSSTAMMDTIKLELPIIPWLEVNMKVEYTSQYSKQKNQYIIKSLSWTYGEGTMSVTLYKFLEDFSFVYNRKHNTGK